MVNKFFKEYAGNKAAFIAAGHAATYFDNIVFIKDTANNGAGSCIYARGSYFANFAELIAALNYVKGIKVGTDTYNAAQGGGYVEFAASTPSTVTIDVNGGKVTIGLTPEFVAQVNTVVSEVATIKGDYLKASDRTALEQLVANTKAEILGNSTTDTKDSKTIEGVRKYVDAKTSGIASESVVSELSNRVATIEGDYLKEEDKTELQNAINTEKSRVDTIAADYLKGEDKTELANRITNEAPVTMTEAAGSGDILKTYTFAQNGKTIGTINLAKELVVTGGEIVEIDGVKNLQLTIANQANPVNIPVTELCDVYTGSEFVNISEGNVISVDKDGIIAGLATDANAQQYAADAKEQAIADADAKLANKANSADVYTKTQVDGLVSPKADKTYVDTELGKKADAENVYTKTEANELLAAKANATDVYTKTEVYTKEEVEAMFAWETIA